MFPEVSQDRPERQPHAVHRREVNRMRAERRWRWVAQYAQRRAARYRR